MSQQNNEDKDFIPRKAKCRECGKQFLQTHENHQYCSWKHYYYEKGRAVRRLAEITNTPLPIVERWSSTKSLQEILEYLNGDTLCQDE